MTERREEFSVVDATDGGTVDYYETLDGARAMIRREEDRRPGTARELFVMHYTAEGESGDTWSGPELLAATYRADHQALRDSVEDALLILGTGDCHVADCEGCRVERQEAADHLRAALDRSNPYGSAVPGDAAGEK